MLVNILSIFAIFCIAFVIGKLVTKLKLPAILGWLITGMAFGPFLVGVVSQEILDSSYYKVFIKIFECFAGVMIGSEIVFKKIAKYGKQMILITLFQSLGTFLVVSFVFSIVFAISNIPIFLAFIFGGIALATAPAPALSIVNQYKTNGSVTKTLIPMAALDDVVGVIVFFTVISIVSGFLPVLDE
jgi:NhaP-type Na+/H+ or K+/H+ antiporter